jgi:hypothetical protein
VARRFQPEGLVGDERREPRDAFHEIAAVVCSTPQEDLMTWSLPDGRNLVKGVAWLAPFIADKALWLKTARHPVAAKKGGPPATSAPVKPDVMYWDDWPVRQPCLIFGALAAGNTDWLATWKKLNPDPTVEEIIRNYPIRQPVLWLRK